MNDRNSKAGDGVRGRAIGLRACALLLALIALALGIPGAKLLMLGGSAYYLVAGLVCLAAATLLWRRRRAGAWLYLLFLVGTLAWALGEAGLDGWALLPRLAGPLLFGLLLLLPGIRRALGWSTARREGFYWLMGLAVLIVAAGAGYAALLAPLTATNADYAADAPTTGQGDWPDYGNDAGGSRYSPLGQITPANVGALQVAWRYHVGAPPPGARAALEVTALKVGDTLYLCSGFNDIIALDAETGAQRWRHHSATDPRGVFGGACRGVSYYRVPGTQGLCAARIYTATVDARLLAVDAATGASCPGFGRGGVVSLLDGIGPVRLGYYHVTSAPEIVRGRIVLGGWVTDGQYVGEPSGVIRAFDAVTGAFAWAFDSGRPDDHAMPAPGRTFTRGTPNSWAPMSADEELGLVYVPTGNATPDYYGGHRTAGDDRVSSAVLALDAQTGALRWSFQTTHHDLWDYDVASQPTLVDLPGGVKGLVQPTKTGQLFLLDRRTGRPIAPVVERPVPGNGVPGERIAPTQPFSPDLPSFAGPPLTEAMMWGLTPLDQLWCRIKFREARYEGPMTPTGTDRPSITYPGYLGGMDWGGVSIDRARGILITNSNRMANYNRLIPRAIADRMGLKPMRDGNSGDVGGPVAQAGTPYAAHITPFLSPLLVPCQQPPYGMISAVDLQSRRLLWTKRFGTGRDSGPLALASHLPFTMGVPSVGGAITTRSGLFFIAASQDRYIRAYDTLRGTELWRARLPAGGQATPMTYYSDRSGRQFVVIAAGGHGGLLTTPGDQIIAYALPRKG